MEWQGGCFCFLSSFLHSFHFSPSFARTPQHHTTSSGKASSAAAMEAGAAPPNTAAAEARYRAVYDEQVCVRCGCRKRIWGAVCRRGPDCLSGATRLYTHTHPYTQMNPFAAFSKAERARRYQNLPPTEKIAYGVAQLFLGSKPARAFFVGYALALHLLVFVTMYVATHHGADSGCLNTPTGLPHPHVAAAAAVAGVGEGSGGGIV